MTTFSRHQLIDRETANIDALAAKVRDAIERPKEYRTALISAAVTGSMCERRRFEMHERLPPLVVRVSACRRLWC